MAISRRLLAATLGLCVALIFGSSESITVEAGSNNTYLDSFNSGVAAMLDRNTRNAAEMMRATERQFITLASEDVEESTLVMANVKSTLNVREEAGEKAKKVVVAEKESAGEGVAKGSDDTLFATVSGVVRFERLGKDKKQVSVYAD